MIFVTTVTCARDIYEKLASFDIVTGGFMAERLTRASDNGDTRHLTKCDCISNVFALRRTSHENILH